MSEPLGASANDWLSPPERTPPAPESPLDDYQAALGRYEHRWLVQILNTLDAHALGGSPSGLPGVIADHLAKPKRAEEIAARLGTGERLVLSLFALTETSSWPMVGLAHALACLGVGAADAIRPLVARGLLAVGSGPFGGPVYDPERFLTGADVPTAVLHAHPAAVSAARTVLPGGEPPPSSGPVRQVRETDGLEPILRVAAVWQRVDEAPLRQTQQGTLYKRDRERIEDDPVLAGPIADALEPLPDMAALWMSLARAVGLLVADPGSERVAAAPAEFWSENAWHLPQMLAARWLGLRGWQEQGGMRQDGSTVELALPYVRPAVLLWLAALPEGAWVALDDLAKHLQALEPDWDRPTFLGSPPPTAPTRGKPRRGKAADRTGGGGADPGVLDSLLLGAAYQFGLVRAAEEIPSGRRVVQLSELGRYLLALGPPPAPRPAFEQFLYVQPNFEIIAYRQGLNPALIGQFSRFARWTQLGAALELRLTPESVYRGLEGGLSPQEMHDRLARHSGRPLPAGVAEALRTWAGRRERVTYHAAATLIEFASRAELEQALALWPDGARAAPVAVSDRLLLVEDEAAIPFQRFRLAGSRDYRRPGETCLEVEPDGVTLTLDLARSDLLVDAELARFTEEQPPEADRSAPGNPRRRFLVTPASLARGARNGMTPALLADWYVRRTGSETPPAVRLMLLAAGARVSPLTTARPVVLSAPTAEVLDGLAQHPDTRPHLGARLGPTAVIVPEPSLEPLRRALRGLGLTLADGGALGPAPGPPPTPGGAGG